VCVFMCVCVSVCVCVCVCKLSVRACVSVCVRTNGSMTWDTNPLPHKREHKKLERGCDLQTRTMRIDFNHYVSSHAM
jgi:hypothetical protein